MKMHFSKVKQLSPFTHWQIRNSRKSEHWHNLNVKTLLWLFSVFISRNMEIIATPNFPNVIPAFE